MKKLDSFGYRLFASAFACLAFAATVTAQETAKDEDKKATPTGSWVWERKGDAGSEKIRLTLKEKNGKVTGSYSDSKRELDVRNGKFKQGALSFELVPFEGKKAVVHKFEGKVTVKAIVGKLKSGEQTTDFNAQRLSPTDAILGKWYIEFETPDGDVVEFEFVVEKTRKKLSIDFLDEGANAKISKVSFKEGLLVFEADQEYQGEDLEVVYELELDGDNIEGIIKYEFVDVDQKGELECVGGRVK